MTRSETNVVVELCRQINEAVQIIEIRMKVINRISMILASSDVVTDERSHLKNVIKTQQNEIDSANAIIQQLVNRISIYAK